MKFLKAFESHANNERFEKIKDAIIQFIDEGIIEDPVFSMESGYIRVSIPINVEHHIFYKKNNTGRSFPSNSTAQISNLMGEGYDDFADYVQSIHDRVIKKLGKLGYFVLRHFDFVNSIFLLLDTPSYEYEKSDIIKIVRTEFLNAVYVLLNDDCIEVDVELIPSDLSVIKSQYPSYWFLYNKERRMLWVKKKPQMVKCSSKYLYCHKPDSMRDEILKYGLRTESNYKDQFGYDNIITVFDMDVVRSYKNVDKIPGMDLWQIDVTELGKSMYNVDIWKDNPNYMFDNSRGIMCTDLRIRPKFVKLIQ